MKLSTIPVALLLLFPTHLLLAQVYTVSRIKGEVYRNNLPVREGDYIGLKDKLRAKDPSAALCMVGPEKGNLILTFQSGIRVESTDQNKHSELYEIVVQESIDSFNRPVKRLATKGGDAFDWFQFFYYGSIASSENRVLIIKGQKLPRTSAVFVTEEPYKLLACVFSNNDSTIAELPIIKDSIIMADKAFKLRSFPWKLKISYTKAPGKGVTNPITKKAIHSTALSQEEISEMIRFFLTGWKALYPSEEEALAELHKFLVVTYGEFYTPYIDRLASNTLVSLSK